MDANFFTDADLEDLWKELDEEKVEKAVDEWKDEEKNASYNRYLEIIKKHKNEE